MSKRYFDISIMQCDNEYRSLNEHRRKKELNQILSKQTKELKDDFHRMGKFLLEEFEKRLSIVAEVQVHQSKKLDATFEKVGELSEDMSFVKDELRMIRNELKEKVDRDEFVSLEKRVMFLEKRAKA